MSEGSLSDEVWLNATRREIRVTVPEGPLVKQVERALKALGKDKRVFVDLSTAPQGGAIAWCISLAERALKERGSRRAFLRLVTHYFRKMPVSYRIGLVEVKFDAWVKEIYSD